ncbi:MAG TPA: HD domain-containing protein [Puia sp.]|nr:HD domain-containing protein [Puia sp.]
MAHQSRKIINDPVYGFITLDHDLLLNIVAHPYYQRLRRINQMAFAHLVYPGAVHSRLHHSLGAYHLMCNAIAELKARGTDIGKEEELGAKTAILLHDIGHGPYSHALEQVLIPGAAHETLSLALMRTLDKQFDGGLDIAIRIFTNEYHKQYLHPLVSGQLDMDRMDYLTRDSFFTGVSEGVIGYDRILKMLTVHEGRLMVEEKAIYSIEKFLVARRLMYWQVYLHKTVLSAEKMLVRIVERAKELIRSGTSVLSGSPVLDYFLRSDGLTSTAIEPNLDQFCLLDDFDVMSAVKLWMFHRDKVLSHLCRRLIDRRLLKVRFQATPFDQNYVTEIRSAAARDLSVSPEEAAYFVFTGEAVNTTYNPGDERINILFKDGSVRDISRVDNALIHQTLASPVKKFYLCYTESIPNYAIFSRTDSPAGQR